MVSEHGCLFILPHFAQDENSSKKVQEVGLGRVMQPPLWGQGRRGTWMGNSAKQIHNRMTVTRRRRDPSSAGRANWWPSEPVVV